MLTRANELALRHNPHELLSFETLARLIHVHVRTLHAAAKDGRLRVTYDTRTTFRRPRSRATLADAETFRHVYFERAVWPKARPAPLTWSQIPPDSADQIRRVRQRLGLTQTQFAARVGAARKAVVYQWESRKRCPSPLFWERVRGLSAAGTSERIPLDYAQDFHHMAWTPDGKVMAVALGFRGSIWKFTPDGK
jgi:ribosome-binding protein aMBF1 (putative translation factor)